MTKKNVPYLLDEPPILVYPTLAKLLGINKAVVLQQVHFLINIAKQAQNNYVFIDGRWWVYNSYEEWQEKYFPWLSVSAIKGFFCRLEKQKIIISRQGVKEPADRRKWYTIDYDAYEQFCDETIRQKMSDDGTKNVSWMGQKMSDDSSETPISETPEEIKEKTITVPTDGEIKAIETSSSFAAVLKSPEESKNFSKIEPTPPAVNEHGEKLQAPPPAAPVWEDVVGDDDEEPEHDLFVRLKHAYADRPSALTEAQQTQLGHKFKTLRDGKIVEIDAPTTLYDIDSLFPEFVSWAIAKQKGYVKDKKTRASRTSMVAHICGYERADGWFKYEKDHRKDHDTKQNEIEHGVVAPSHEEMWGDL